MMPSLIVSSCTLLLAGALTLAAGQADATRPKPEVFDFGVIGVEQPWEHAFPLQNTGTEPLQIKNVQLTPPLVVTKMPARIAPGETGSVAVKLETPRDKGEFQASITVNFAAGRTEPAVYWVRGRIVTPIDFEPFGMFFISTQRGQPKTATIEMASYESEPLKILNVQHASPRFKIDVDELTPGRRYRLALTMTGDGPAGRDTDTVTLYTTSRLHPRLEIRANTNLNERVHIFPDSIDLGAISAQQLRNHPELLAELTQRVMIYQEGGKDFQIHAETDMPFLRVSTDQAALKDRFELQIKVTPEKLKPGEVYGAVIVATNDAEFPRVQIPVRGRIED